MTELIIIGNGFDLAHGMKTAYSDYIRAMLLDALNNAPEYRKLSPFYLGKNIIEVLRAEGEEDLVSKIGTLFKEPQSSKQKTQKKTTEQAKNLTQLYRDVAKARHYTLSPLVSLLIEDFEKKGWVDLEQSYFDVLCKSHTDREAIEQLNEDMSLLRESMQRYLAGLKTPPKEDAITDHLTEIINKFKKTPTKKNAQKVVSFKEADIIILNFNYTNTIRMYLDTLEIEEKHNLRVLNIHGSLASENIILGYGDEDHKMFKTLEEANDNSLTRHLKSFYYMKSLHYMALAYWLSRDNFRIHIMGHSCGLSDRVLLSSLFNHENLQSIRIYYYEKDKKENDYFEKCQNISRHFFNKHQMRCKILPDTITSEPMYRSIPLVPYKKQ